MTPQHNLPIGIFDSGIGGLTVARALLARLPGESLIYFGDTARVPYGIKSVETISQFAGEITAFLLARRVKLLIVACNTMAAVAAEAIAGRATVPVLDVIDAGVREAVAATRNGQVGVIGTLATVSSAAYETAIRARDPGIRVYSQACPLFVPLVEEGWLDHPVTRLTADDYLRPLLARAVDTLVLGCTHYPLLKPVLKDVVGPAMRLIDSAETVAAQAQALLQAHGLERQDIAPPTHRLFVTDLPQRFQAIGERFLGRSLAPIEVVKL